MSVTAHWFDKALNDAFVGNAAINWASDTIKCALLTSSYTPNLASDHVWSDISANEISGTGYTAGGASLGTKTNATTSHVLGLGAANTVWTSSTLTASYAVIYDTSISNLLLGVVEFGSSISSTGASFTITWASGLVLTITAS